MSTHKVIICDQLQSRIPSLAIVENKSLYSLPPVDLLLPDDNNNIVIEVQGPSQGLFLNDETVMGTYEQLSSYGAMALTQA